jgi:two-component system nitrate/nitrite response regulator NarL
MTTSSRLRIRVCHEDPLVMAGLVALIAREPDLEVEAASDVAGDAVDVVVADYACALALLGAASPPGVAPRLPRIIVMTRRDREREVLHAIQSGAHGYLLQDTGPAQLMNAIRQVGRVGSRCLCQRAASLLERAVPRTGLTAREEDVLHHLVRGDCNKGIARKLDISANTVKAHVSRICEKLHVRSRAQVAVEAMQRGLVRAAFSPGARPTP